MALPTSGGGYQQNDGNATEAKLNRQLVTTLGAGNATLTAAMLAAGLISVTGGAGAQLTLDSGANLDTQIPNARINDSFDAIVQNADGANAATVAAGAGVTLVGSGALAAGGSIRLRFIRTGVGLWTAYRI